MKCKNVQYCISYLSKGEKIDELYSTAEVMIILILSKFNKNIEIIKIERGEFYSD